jgi:hypothetical protein
LNKVSISLDITKQKSNKRSMVETIPRETKREGQRKAKRCIAQRAQKEGES